MKRDTLIQDIKPQQIGQLRRLFQRAVKEDFNYFPTTYQKQVLEDNNWPHLVIAALKPSRIMLGAYHAGQMIGYLIAGINGDDRGKIYWLYVSPEGRGQKLGQALLEHSLEQMRRRGMRRVSLVTHNYANYYAKLGFSPDKAEELYGVDMKVMSYQWAK